VRRVHFVGVGGIGMSGLAEILAASGYAVSGSDLHESKQTERLRALGVRVSVPHRAEHAQGADVVVYSSAVPPHNPEILAAEASRIPVIPRAEMLAELMRLKYGVAISGSHGKTTTTSMIGAVLATSELDPTIVVGGRVKSLGTNSRLGAGDVLVAEADESDGSFLGLIPTVVVITNIDREHMDHYGSFERLQQAFLDFANRVPFYGVALLCLDDPHVREILPQVRRRTRTYGLSPQAEISAAGIEPLGLTSRFQARAGGRPLGSVRIGMPGRHNVQNALAAIAAGLEFDVPFPEIAAALEEFGGVERRFEIKGEREGVLVIDDYSHHPVEIRAALRTARDALGRRIVLAFQPHRYSRTADLFEELAQSFHDADLLILCDIYPAGEVKRPDVNLTALAEAVRARGHRAVHEAPELSALVRQLRELTRPGDALFFMGAGDISHQAEVFLSGDPR
jgi:UDP-N-acetylmuramate--alanine ligase